MLQSAALINFKLIKFKNSIVTVSLPGQTVIGCLVNGFISYASDRWGTLSIAIGLARRGKWCFTSVLGFGRDRALII